MTLTTDDVRAACDVLRPVFDATSGVDGRVSIEVDPRLAHEVAPTVEQAVALHARVDRPNVMIKILATLEGLPAITQVLAQGSASMSRWSSAQPVPSRDERLPRGSGGRPGGRPRPGDDPPVASFFVSRVDTEVDKRLDAIGTDAARAMKGKAAVANAQLAYQAHEEVFATPRWRSLADDGARPQRPLWASTGVKDPAYPDTLYVTGLVAAGTVNTMPEKTMQAVADHGVVTGDTVTGEYASAEATLEALEALGVSYADVVELLERDGVAKFASAWADLLAGVDAALAKARTS